MRRVQSVHHTIVGDETKLEFFFSSKDTKKEYIRFG